MHSFMGLRGDEKEEKCGEPDHTQQGETVSGQIITDITDLFSKAQTFLSFAYCKFYRILRSLYFKTNFK